MLRKIITAMGLLALAACAHQAADPDYGALHPTYIVFFGTNSADLTPDAYAIAQRVAEGVRAVHPQAVEIVGFSDRVGSEAADHNIAQQRTAMVQKTLTDAGVSPALIVTLPLGNPMDEMGPTANRRVEIHLIKDFSAPAAAASPSR